ncbi:hypothetical protein E4U13_008285 [Claviceps humidiphila]|uniref:Signal recognition particle protein Sec65 n=1 Tax=Claviceps humidiphila TaxID=1294629 RepID=A0A9P7Q5K8_9HYPO|nr:hypothetical protein E4U13_008285 [Claviceps humidiphila]
MSRAIVEECSDSDPDMVIPDPDEDDIDDFLDSDIIRRVPPTTSTGSSNLPQQQQQLPLRPHPQTQHHQPPTQLAPDRSAFNSYQCLYPIYFDSLRTRTQGRRVPSSLASPSPLAREIATACSQLRLPTVLEPDKTHPKDWANPGRVKVCLKAPPAGPGPQHGIRNKHHLYILVAKHLLENPTTEDSPGLRARLGGQVQPPEGTAYPRPAVPRGWKISEFVPYVSPAMTGGGVSENLLTDMMRGMQGGGDPMAALMAGATGGAGMGGMGGMGMGMGLGEGAAAASSGGKKKKDKKGKGKS